MELTGAADRFAKSSGVWGRPWEPPKGHCSSNRAKRLQATARYAAPKILKKLSLGNIPHPFGNETDVHLQNFLTSALGHPN